MKEIIASYFAGELSSDKKEEFFRQLSENQEYEDEFVRMQNIWSLAGLSTPDSDLEDANYYLEEFKKRRSHKQMRTLFTTLAKYAAILLVGMFVAYGVLTRFQPVKQETTYNQLTVPAGQRVQLKLQDGTIIWLNSLSTLTYPSAFTGDIREVALDGEAYFDVSKDAKRAFIVKTNKFDIRVFGTEFNVLAYSDNSLSEVSLLKGSVEVKPAGKNEAYRMKENEKISFKNEKIISNTKNPDSQSDKKNAEEKPDKLPGKGILENKLEFSEIKDYDYFRWKEGLICFNNETVGDIMEKLHKIYDIQINVNKPTLLKLRYSGKFRTIDGVEQVIKVLQLEHKFYFERDKEKNLITIK
jgi:ferric-dicitrate binding protein FerR (iron transport regulator)